MGLEFGKWLLDVAKYMLTALFGVWLILADKMKEKSIK